MSELMSEIGIRLPYLEYLKQSASSTDALMDYSVRCFLKNDFVLLLFFLQKCFLSLSNNHDFILTMMSHIQDVMKVVLSPYLFRNY